MTNIYFNFDRNRPLFNKLDGFNPPERLEVPVAFIMGSEDYVTNASLAKDYFNRVEAPSKKFFVFEGTGHNLMLSQPKTFMEMLYKALAEFSS